MEQNEQDKQNKTWPLSLEVHEQIFTLLEGDEGSLFGCLLVCRDWSRQVVPHLYSSPQWTNQACLKTILKCLDTSERQQLIASGIQLEEGLPLYEYSRSIRELSVNDVCCGCRDYAVSKKMVDMICRCVVRSSDELHSISVCTWDEEVPAFAEFQNITQVLGKLKDFGFETRRSSSKRRNPNRLFALVADNCGSLQSFEFYSDSSAPSIKLANSLLGRAHLESLVTDTLELDWPSMGESFDTLKSIRFMRTQVDVTRLCRDILTTFQNCRKLILTTCEFTLPDRAELHNPPSLAVTEFCMGDEGEEESFMNKEGFRYLLQCFSHNLSSLGLRDGYPSPSVLGMIGERFKFLDTLVVCVNEENMRACFQLLGRLDALRTLSIHVDEECSLPWPDLSRTIPRTVTWLHFVVFQVSSRNLVDFYSELDRTISRIDFSCNYFTKAHITVLIKHAKEGLFKKVGFRFQYQDAEVLAKLEGLRQFCEAGELKDPFSALKTYRSSTLKV